MGGYFRRGAGFRDGASEGKVGGLGVVDPPAVSGPAVVVAAAPEDPRRAAPHLLNLPRPVFLDRVAYGRRGLSHERADGYRAPDSGGLSTDWDGCPRSRLPETTCGVREIRERLERVQVSSW
jgi:hypothetical protein